LVASESDPGDDESSPTDSPHLVISEPEDDNIINRSTTNSPSAYHHAVDEPISQAEISLLDEHDKEFVEMRCQTRNELLRWHQSLNQDVERFNDVVNQLKMILPEDATAEEYFNATSRELLVGYTDDQGEWHEGLWGTFCELIDSGKEDWKDATIKFRRLDKIFQIEPRHFTNEILSQLSKRFEIPLLSLRLRLLEGQHILNDCNSNAPAFEKKWEQKLLSLKFLLESYMQYRGCYTNLHKNPDTFPSAFAFGTLYFTCKDGRKQKKDMSQLIMTALLELQKRGGKKRVLTSDNPDGHNTQVLFPKMVDGNFAYYFEPTSEKKATIFDWVRSVFAERTMELGYFGPAFDVLTAAPRTFHNIANWLAAFDTPVFPEVEPHRNLFSCPNGLYCSQNLKFYTWAELKDQDCDIPIDIRTYSAMNYLPEPFPLELRDIAPEDCAEIPTPATDRIFISQGFDKDTRIILWLWAFIGRNFFWLRDMYGEGWECALGFIGCSRTGKSLLIRLILSFFHPSQVAYLSNNCQKQFVLEAFLNAWILASFELDKDIANSFSVTDMFMIVSGETGPVSRKFKVSVNVEFKIPFVFAGNEVPTFSKPGTINADKGEAIAARLLICKMAWTIPKNQLDTTLFSQMLKERWYALHKSCSLYHYFASNYGMYSIWSPEVNLPKFFINANAEVKSATHPLVAFFDSATSTFKYAPLTSDQHKTTYVSHEFFFSVFKKWCADNGFPTNFRWEPGFWSTPFAWKNLTVSATDEDKPDPNDGNKRKCTRWIYGLHIKTELDTFQERVVSYITKNFANEEGSNISLETFKQGLKTYFLDEYDISEEKIKSVFVENSMFCEAFTELGYEHTIKKDDKSGLPSQAMIRGIKVKDIPVQ
jgi:hypothetical protein